jgi:hypothetical protein
VFFNVRDSWRRITGSPGEMAAKKILSDW